VDEVKALATMPGKEELFSKLLFLINAPAQRLATVLNATGATWRWFWARAWRRKSLPRRLSGGFLALSFFQFFSQVEAVGRDGAGS
jgi:hypothetical protein